MHRCEDPNSARRAHHLMKDIGTQRKNCRLVSTIEGLRLAKGQLTSLGKAGLGRLAENEAP